MDNLVIIHFQPIERYPPIQNLLCVIKNRSVDKNFLIITTAQTQLPEFVVKSDTITIIRKDIKSSDRIIRLFKYAYFYLFTFFKLIKTRPLKVLYFESISAFPAILYKLLFKKTKLFVHYHEYTTCEEYRNGMQLVKWSHIFEAQNYAKYTWISHTNQERLNLFRNDLTCILDSTCFVMPNYPMSNWINQIQQTNKKLIIKNRPVQLVYVGALSIEDTYIKELIEFIINQPDKYELEIFSLQFPEELSNLIVNQKSKNIKFSGPINYMDIPGVLQEKEVGLILYKGNTLNYVHNAPNKLFEYLTCGLDVWFPKEMVGCYEYLSIDNPKVMMIDFSNIKDSLINYCFCRDSERMNSVKLTAEEACEKLIVSLTN